ncbi:unnamed protein product, partial [Meganyctiphanes norvegica]
FFFFFLFSFFPSLFSIYIFSCPGGEEKNTLPYALSNIELVFLSPNTTSHTQPLDQGIIANFKSHYRHMYTLGYLWPDMEAGKPPAFNLFDVIQVAAQAWSMVTSRTIARCFKRAGFKHLAVTEPTPQEEEENLPLAHP